MNFDSPLFAKAKKLIKPIGWILTILGVGFVGYALMQADLGAALTLITPWEFVASVIVYSLGTFLLAMAWISLLMPLAHEPLDKRHLFIVYARSVLTKYLPGNVFQYVTRHTDLHGKGVKQLKIAKSIIYEILSHTIGAGFIVCIGLAVTLWAGVSIPHVPDWLVGLTSGFGIVVTAAIFIVQIGPTKLLRLSLPYHICFLVVLEGISLFLLTQALPGAFEVLPFGAFSLAWLAGYVVIGAPGGLGVREAAYVALLQSFGDIGLLAAAALTLRAISVIGDTLFASAVIAYNSKKNPD